MEHRLPIQMERLFRKYWRVDDNYLLLIGVVLRAAQVLQDYTITLPLYPVGTT